MQNQLGIEVKINDTFALGLDYPVRHNTDVLPGTEKTDQVFTANLVYGFKFKRGRSHFFPKDRRKKVNTPS